LPKLSNLKLYLPSCVHPYSFEQYLDLHRSVVAKSIELDEVYHDEKLWKYTCDNLDRNDYVLDNLNLDKKLYNILEQIPSLKCIIISEPWCGDAAQIVPVLAAIAESSLKMECTIYLRDENEALIDQFLTNGGRAIPIAIFTDEDDNVLFHWGPRPAPAQTLVMDMKAKDFSKRDFTTTLHQWYKDDKTKAIQEEIYQLLKTTISQ
jgi:hypothetical protein